METYPITDNVIYQVHFLRANESVLLYLYFGLSYIVFEYINSNHHGC